MRILLFEVGDEVALISNLSKKYIITAIQREGCENLDDIVYELKDPESDCEEYLYRKDADVDLYLTPEEEKACKSFGFLMKNQSGRSLTYQPNKYDKLKREPWKR